MRRANIVQEALQRSIDDNLSVLQRQLERQHEDEASGKDMRIAIHTTNEQIDGLTAELRRRRQELERRKVVSIQTPRVVGVAAAIPGPVPHVIEEGRGGDNTTVEMAAMQVAMDYERAHGREAEDVSKTGVGCDVKSVAADGAVRYIEVKGHAATGDITLYYTEWQLAHRMREEFFIYDVDYALTNPDLRIVQDPHRQGRSGQGERDRVPHPGCRPSGGGRTCRNCGGTGVSEKDPTGSAPGHDHKIPEGLDFLRLLRQRERECEAAFDEWLPSAGEKAPKTIEALGTALSYLDLIASCWWRCDGGDHQRERIIGRAVSNTRAALLLLRSGYYDEALGVTRQIGEIANLLLLFMRDDEAFVEWAGLGDQARRRSFRAVRVREKLEALGFGMAMDEDLYRKLSGVSVHANPNTVPQGHNVFSIPTMGAVFQDGRYPCFAEPLGAARCVRSSVRIPDAG